MSKKVKTPMGLKAKAIIIWEDSRTKRYRKTGIILREVFGIGFSVKGKKKIETQSPELKKKNPSLVAPDHRIQKQGLDEYLFGDNPIPKKKKRKVKK